MSSAFSFVADGLVSPGMRVGSWEIGSGFGRWFSVERDKREFAIVPEDMEGPIEPTPDNDLVPGWRQGR